MNVAQRIQAFLERPIQDSESFDTESASEEPSKPTRSNGRNRLPSTGYYQRTHPANGSLSSVDEQQYIQEMHGFEVCSKDDEANNSSPKHSDEAKSRRTVTHYTTTPDTSTETPLQGTPPTPRKLEYSNGSGTHPNDREYYRQSPTQPQSRAFAHEHYLQQRAEIERLQEKTERIRSSRERGGRSHHMREQGRERLHEAYYSGDARQPNPPRRRYIAGDDRQANSSRSEASGSAGNQDSADPAPWRTDAVRASGNVVVQHAPSMDGAISNGSSARRRKNSNFRASPATTNTSDESQHFDAWRQTHQRGTPPRHTTMADQVLRGFQQVSSQKSNRPLTSPASNTHRAASPHTTQTGDSSTAQRLALHDLIAEATSIDDVAWRNALHLLANQPELANVADTEHGWTPLHVCAVSVNSSTGRSIVPNYFWRALLYASPEACAQADLGGRLPLHLVAASSASDSLLQLVVDEAPRAVSQVDEHGLTPLMVLLRNTVITITPKKIRILLGWMVSTISSSATLDAPIHSPSRVLQRRGQHLKLPLERLNAIGPQPVTTYLNRAAAHEKAFEADPNMPNDVRLCLRTLAQWRHSSRSPRRSKAPADGAEADVDDSLSGVHRLNDSTISELLDYRDIDISPASIPSQIQYPIHVLVDRAITERDQAGLEESEARRMWGRARTLPVDMDEEVPSSDEGRRCIPPLCKKTSDDETSEYGDETLRDLSESDLLKTPKHVLFDESMRVLSIASPDSLLQRNVEGLTPLLMLLTKEPQPRYKTVQFLLGEYGLPAWARDLPPNSIRQAPAMVSAAGTDRQWPLHIAAEECLPYPIVKLIYEAYPGVVSCTDGFHRTPLHVALTSYRKKDSLDHDTLELLMQQAPLVARKRDARGNIPLDLLVDTADGQMPLPESSNKALYRRFLQESLTGNKDFDMSRLQSLPPWIRREAAATWSVQEAVCRALANPITCALILLDGLVSLALIVIFRLQVEEHIDVIGTGERVGSWYTYTVYGMGTFRLLVLASGCVAGRCVWSKLSVSLQTICMSVVLLTSLMLFNNSFEEASILRMETLSTALLWLNLIIYLCTWWCGLAIFAGGFWHISRGLLGPLVVLVSILTGAGQMVYTFAKEDCEDTSGSPIPAVCSIRDAYRYVYVTLFLGGSAVMGDWPKGNAAAVHWEWEQVALVTFLLSCLMLFVVTLLIYLIMTASRVDMEQLALECYWEPKIVLLNGVDEKDTVLQRVQETGSSLERRLGHVWDTLTLPWRGNRHERKANWYARSMRSPLSSVCFGFMAIFIVPLWFVLGALTLGFLWPPQVRQGLFRPTVLQKQRSQGVLSVTEVSDMRKDMRQFHQTSCEQSEMMTSELRKLKEILGSALKQE